MHLVPCAGPGDPGAGGRGELRYQAGACGGEAAVQHGQRESGEGAGYHQRAAAAEGEAVFFPATAKCMYVQVEGFFCFVKLIIIWWPYE